ncbi:MAG: porin [Gammaproteobacteria bacterium]|nr:porin [Gammaproteobacteria bacterium]
MNRKLLTLAVGAALTAGPTLIAHADLRIGGFAQVELAREKTKNAAGATALTATTVEDNSRGRFWLDADEDLGGGLKGIMHFEFRVDTTGNCGLETGGATCNSKLGNLREKWVGLQSGFGTIKLGSLRQPYKYAGGVLWDQFFDTNLQAPDNGGMSGTAFGHANFFDNALGYYSPSFGGVTFNVAYSFDDVNDTANGQSADDGDYSASVEWKGLGGDLHVIAARSEDQNNALGASQNSRAHNKAGAKYTFLKNYSVIGQYEKIDNDAKTLDQKVYFLGFNATFGNVLAVLHWGKTKDDITNNDTDYLAVGGWYKFSKSFDALAGYRKTSVDNGNEDTVFTVGLRKGF